MADERDVAAAGQQAGPGDSAAEAAFVLGLCAAVPGLGLWMGGCAVVLAVAALVRRTKRRFLALAGLCCGLLLAGGQMALMALGIDWADIWTGVWALKRAGIWMGGGAVALAATALVRRTKRRFMAIAGLCCGLLLAGGNIAIITDFAGIKTRLLTHPPSSGANLNGIGKAIVLYAGSNHGQTPPSLDVLVEANLVSTKMLVSPESGRQPPRFEGGKLIGELDYIYMPQVAALSEANRVHPDCIVAYERPENHKGKGTYVLLASWNVAWVNQAEFQEWMQLTKDQLARPGGR